MQQSYKCGRRLTALLMCVLDTVSMLAASLTQRVLCNAEKPRAFKAHVYTGEISANALAAPCDA